MTYINPWGRSRSFVVARSFPLCHREVWRIVKKRGPVKRHQVGANHVELNILHTGPHQQQLRGHGEGIPGGVVVVDDGKQSMKISIHSSSHQHVIGSNKVQNKAVMKGPIVMIAAKSDIMHANPTGGVAGGPTIAF